ncbi:MAG: polyphosphate kinase 2 family protein [Micrococcales bacterium]|nr:polyphosphate kinase 2 family protein [Micrococcales bacterium]
MPKKSKKTASKNTKTPARVADEISEPSQADEAATEIFSRALRYRPQQRLADIDPRCTPGFTGGKEAGKELLGEAVEEIGDLQERLYAAARGGSNARLLLVVQGMDTSGKGGIMRHVVGLMDPQGVDLTSFKAPTAVEHNHPFLWRVRRALPKPGQVGVFDRSHYEDVLIVRVHNLVSSATWSRRYGQINTFEESCAKEGITMIKVMLHISKQEQGERLAERLANPEKYWKYNPGDIDERKLWEDYQVAYQAVLDKTSTDLAPWFVVPADRKWYARLAVQQLLLEHLQAMDPQWPAPTFDVTLEQERLALS